MEGSDGDAQGRAAEYQVVRHLRRGSYAATNLLLLHKPDNKRYVMKKIRLPDQTDKFERTARREMALIAKLNNPYIAEFKDAWMEKDTICLVTAYCEGGDMEEKIQKARGSLFTEERICKWFTQLLLALDYLHSNRVVHREIKCSNIFITKDDDIRLGDFGFGKLLGTKDLTPVLGSPNYMCPELLVDAPYGYKSDIWSLGCCMFEITAHQAAFRATDMTGLINKINRSTTSPLPHFYSSSLKRLIKSMLRKNPEHRPTTTELLRNPHLEMYLAKSSNALHFLLPIKKNPASPAELATGSQYDRQTHYEMPKGENISEVDVQIEKENVVDKLRKDLSLVADVSDIEIKRADTDSSQKAENNSVKKKDQSIIMHPTDDITNQGKQKQNPTGGIFPKHALQGKSDIEGKDDGTSQHEEADIKKGVATQTLQKAEVASGEKDKPLREKSAECVTTLQHGNTAVIEDDLNTVHHRAEALESLLELCAELVKTKKYDELASILRPFGQESISSREIAIWLTRRSISMPKFEEATFQ